MSDSLSPEDRLRLEELFERAVELPRAQQSAFVEAECGSNEALRRELARLLDALVSEDHLRAIQTGAPSREGMRIGPYRLLERVGEGGMGEVYAAEQQEPIARRVALKIIKPGMDSRQVLARFEAERHALARMTHPNIGRVLDGGTAESGSPYFVMEFVSGEPINEYCDRHKLTTRERLELFLGVCDGVQHAHQKGIIHRDLKPSNLLVTQQDGRAVPKIIGFGVARATTGRLVDRTLQTMVGQIVGTLDYMSPEQADPSSVELDTRSDVYSLGVVLYELLSGLLPFEHHLAGEQSLLEIQRTIRDKDPPTPSTRLRRRTGTATRIAPLRGTDGRSLLRQLSGDLDWICMKALEKDPARRYATVNGLGMDIQRHLDGEPVVAAPPSARYRLGKFVRRNKTAVTAGAAVMVVLLLGIGGTAYGLLRASESRTAAAAARRRADNVSGFVASIFDSADPWNRGGRQEMTVLEALENGIRDLDSGRFEDDPETRASLQSTIGLILLNNGRTEDADRMFGQALETRRRLHPGDDPDVAASLNSLALVREERYGWEAAEPLQREAVEMYRRLYPDGDGALLGVLNNLAFVLTALDRPAEAEPLIEEAVEMCRRMTSGDELGLAMFLRTRAHVRAALHKTVEAHRGFEEAIAMMRRLYPTGSPHLARTLWLSGCARMAEGDPAAALPDLEEAVKLAVELFPVADLDRGEYQKTLAECRAALGE